MTSIARIGAAVGLISLSFGGLTAGAHLAAAATDTVGYVYVNDNSAGVNTVAGFGRHADGTLTPLPGSPFAVGGAGTGSSLGSQGALQVTPNGRYLLAVDAGSNQISVLHIHRDGTLTPIADSPVASNGIEPVSISVRDTLVYVANAGDGGANYTGFRLGFGGHLRAIPGSTVPVPNGAGLGEVLINGDGTRVIGVRVNPSLIDSFTLHDGYLTAAPGSPFAAQAAGPFGSAFRPTNAQQLFVSNAHAGAGNGTVSAFFDGPWGVLTPIGASPYADNQTAPCWVAISPDGGYLFAANTASATISSYSISFNGSLTLLGSTALAGGTGARPVELGIDPSDHSLYVVEAGRDAVGAFSLSGGTLTELSASPFALPSGAMPFGLAVTGLGGEEDE